MNQPTPLRSNSARSIACLKTGARGNSDEHSPKHIAALTKHGYKYVTDMGIGTSLWHNPKSGHIAAHNYYGSWTTVHHHATPLSEHRTTGDVAPLHRYLAKLHGSKK